jgi:glycosylphosphatidylinositol transamidase (GPIT) subunit GPI8
LKINLSSSAETNSEFDFSRYHEIFFMIDTCQAASMYEKFYSPNILAVASSLVGEDSLSVNIMQDLILSTF